MTDGEEQIVTANTEAPIDTEAFFRAGPEIDILDAPAPEMTPILERLGPAPFKKPGFPVLGFLTTVYEHVHAHFSGQANK
jgi:hypothetical protein